MVYEPREDSELLRKYVRKFAFGKVLDMGTGSGIQALEAARKKRVGSVLAIDVDEKVVDFLKSEIKKKKEKSKFYQKIKVKNSDLFSGVRGKFDTIIFNPPYLPEDKIAGKVIEDKALYGGRKGYEVLERFLDSASVYLTTEGMVLIVFSSLTKKEKIDSIIRNNLFEFEELEKEHVSFEDLFAYKIWKSNLLVELSKKKIKNLKYFAHGKRGDVFIGVHKNKKIAVKTKRKESLATGRMENEVKWLKKLNILGIGPKLLFFGKNYLVYEFVAGDFILDWMKKNKKNKIKIRKTIAGVLRQCFKMDMVGVNKEEMHRPIKHVIVFGKGRPAMIDFERCYKTKKPHNVTQFGVFLMRQGLLGKKAIGLLKDYKKEMTEKNLIKIIKSLK